MALQLLGTLILWFGCKWNTECVWRLSR
jgi:hypothetical protein